MVELIINKSKALKFLNEKLNEGDSLLLKTQSIKSESDFENLIDIHENWWKSTSELLKQIFNNKRIADNFQSDDSFFFENKNLNQKSLDFQKDIQSDLIKISAIIDNISKDLYKSKKQFEFSYNGIISMVKTNKIGAIILLLIAGFFGVTKFINEFSKAKENIEKFNKTNDESNSEDTISKELIDNQVEDVNTNLTLVDSLNLPYLKNVPILDKGIYLRYNYNDLIIGGVNIDSLKINARTYDGEPLEFREHNKTIETSITQQPYIELKYKSSFYSIEILGKHYSFDCIIKKNIIPTLNLKQIKN